MIGTIDLNADLGEDESPEGIERDLAMMDVISSCNIACGGHAGSKANIRKMLISAKEKGVSAGAHPSYPDHTNFGRVSMDIAVNDLKDSLNIQLTTIHDAALETGMEIRHLKPHGALYNDAQDRHDLAELLAELAADAQLALVGMAGSAVHQKAQAAGVTFIAEAFIDRKYGPDMRLIPRGENGAVIADENERTVQGLALAQGQPITIADGRSITVDAQTLCLHSDSDGALATARSMRAQLEKSGLTIRAAH